MYFLLTACNVLSTSDLTVLINGSQVMAPFTPFLCELMYQNLRRAQPSAPTSVHWCDFPELPVVQVRQNSYMICYLAVDCSFIEQLLLDGSLVNNASVQHEFLTGSSSKMYACGVACIHCLLFPMKSLMLMPPQTCSNNRNL